MYKRNLSHLLTREHSGQGHADMLAHIHTHSHTYKHILASNFSFVSIPYRISKAANSLTAFFFYNISHQICQSLAFL